MYKFGPIEIDYTAGVLSYTPFVTSSRHTLVLLVTLRILALPVPEILAHGFQILSSLESELFFGKGGICREIGDIPATTIQD